MQNNRELPHDLLAERSLLAGLLIDSHTYDQISDQSIDKDDFYHPQHATIFEAIKLIHLEGRPVDFVSVCSKLGDLGKLESIGGQSAIMEITEDVATATNTPTYAKLVKEKSILREIVRNAMRVVDTGMNFNGSVNEFVSEVEASFFKLTGETRSGGLRDIKEFLKVNLADLADSDRKMGEISGLPTGFVHLDKKLLGLQPGQMIVIAARPGMGKTAFALNLATNSTKATGLPVAIFSLEMIAPELSQRILTSEASVDAHRIRSKTYLESDLKGLYDAAHTINNLPLYINDRGDVNLLDIKGQCRKLKMDKGLGLIIIDYLQLMQSHTNNPSREQQISEISRGLKNLAKELECPIIALSQLNRAVESRSDRRPLVADLRESGAIEQDADIVILLYRDEVYNKESPDKGIAEVIIGKNRAGEQGTVKLAWVGSQFKFATLQGEGHEERAH